MRRVREIWIVSLLLSLVLAAPALGSGVTNASEDLRTGWYPNQPSLTPQLVSGGTFGQLWSANVEGQVYAQPLLDDGTVVVATETNKVYGLDPATGALKWPKALNLGTPWNPADIGCGDLTPSIGVTGTPVIDPATNTAYMTHKTYVSGTSGPARWYMDAVEVTTGLEKPGFPVELGGTAQNASGRTFLAADELQRPGLLLMEGVVYAAFAGHCDHSPWQGWIFGVSTAGQVKARWTTDATAEGAGIWQSGAGITSDGPGTMLVSTGNGGAPSTPTPGASPPSNLGESVVRLKVQADGTLKATDFFAPFEAPQLDSWDADFASGGVTGLPNEYFGTATIPHLAVAVGKEGYVYLLNRDNLGGFSQGPSGSDNVVQRIGPYGGVWSRPGVWPGDGGWVYIPTASGGNSASGSAGNLRVYKYGLSGTGTPTLSLQATSSDAFGFGTSAPVITSDGTTSGSALVWTVWMPNGAGTGAQLRAYDPVPVNGLPVLRWSAPIGTASKFNTPGVGAGRLFVGTRDGHVLGFGSPVTPPLSGSAVAFPTTTLGSTSQKTLTLTANESLTLSTLTSSSTQFKLGTPSQALPATLVAGQTITVPVTFAPTQTGTIGGSVTATTSTGKTAAFALTGGGQAATALLEVSPPIVAFGGTVVGGHIASTATFRNVGGAPLTIDSVDLPAAPFSATGVPALGSTIAPGGSLTITVAFDPTAAGSFNDEIGMETSGGDGAVGLSGTAGSSGVLKITNEVNEYGQTAVGTTSTKSFTITNTGGTVVTITKSKPPTGGAFAATTSLAEGTTIAAGASVTEKVNFTPTGPGYASGTWQINGDDTTGLHQLQFSGTGTVPPPTAGSWTNNGTASIAGSTLTLTGLATESAGTSFFNTPVDTRHLVVNFDSTIGGGNVGADGETLVLADPTRGAKTTSLGAPGGGLGFTGIPGIAVALVTYKSPGAPSANFVGVTDGPGTAVDAPHWLATSTAIPSLRATRHVKIEVLNGVLTVAIEGTQVISLAVTLPAQTLLGFSGGSGFYTDNHQVANVTIAGDAAPVSQAATLKLTNTVSAPSGSAQASATMVLSGTCPASFTTAALGNGASATPSLPTAVAGSSCTVSEPAPAAAGGSWSTTASVNGGPEVTLTAVGGQLTVPAFALLAGANTVALKNTWTPPAASSTIPDPSAGGWQLNGSSAISGSELVLTTPLEDQKGSAFWPQAIDPRNLTIEYEASITGGSGADGLALVFGDVSKGAKPTSLGEGGGGLGFSGTPGIAVALDEYKNSVNPSANFTGIADGPAATATDMLHWLGTANLLATLQGQTHRVKVTTTSTAITVAIDGTSVLTQAVTLPASAYLGFSGGTGGLNNRHAISHLVVISTSAPPPPATATLKLTNTVAAPSGSAQASATFVFSGACPSSFTTAALATGGSATPTLTGAVAGSSCTVGEPVPTAPAGGKWTVTASVNGGAAQTLTVTGGTASLPAFVLVAGANTVAFTNTYQPPPPPATATLKLTNTVAAPSGSAQASATFVFSGACPSSFTTAALATGGSATPTLTGAVAGSSCTVSEPVPAAPAGGKWTVTVSVNGGAAQTLTVTGGTASLPAFALVAGANTVAFTNTYQPPPPTSSVPNPAAGGWQLNGSAAISGSELVLTTPLEDQKGSAFWPQALDPRALRIEYDASIGGGSGADGLALVFGDVSKGAKPTSLGEGGGGLGFSGTPGIAVALDEYKNSVNPSANFTGVADGPTTTATDKLHWLGTANLLATLQGQTHHVTVTTTSTSITVAIDGTSVLTQAVTLPASAYLGFSGGTGGLNNRHAIANLVVTPTG